MKGPGPPRRSDFRQAGPAPRRSDRPRGGQSTLADRLFGRSARLFGLGPLWFLWYLLVFITIAPLVSHVGGWIILRPTPEAFDRMGRRALRQNLAPLVLGLATVPALMAAAERFTFALGRAAGIPATFPDFLLAYQPDMPFYLGYFLAGWWLFRMRDLLPDVARLWLPALLFGTLGHFAAISLSGAFADGGKPGTDLIRLGGFSLYAIGAAYTTFGFLGFFRRMSTGRRAGRYLADTAFWVYLVHQELLQGPLSHLLGPLRTSGWSKSLLAFVLATGIAPSCFTSSSSGELHSPASSVRPGPLGQRG